MDGEHQLAVDVGVLRADLQDVLPRGRVLGNPHLEAQSEAHSRRRGGEVLLELMGGKKNTGKKITLETEYFEFYNT